MSEKNNSMAIHSFALHKNKFDRALKQLSSLSQLNFHLDETSIDHKDCAELWLQTEKLENIVTKLFNYKR